MQQETLIYICIAAAIAFVLGIIISRATASKPKALTMDDVTTQAIEDLQKIFWSKDITHSAFGDMARDIRDDAWDEAAKLQRRLIRKAAKPLKN